MVSSKQSTAIAHPCFCLFFLLHPDSMVLFFLLSTKQQIRLSDLKAFSCLIVPFNPNQTAIAKFFLPRKLFCLQFFWVPAPFQTQEELLYISWITLEFILFFVQIKPLDSLFCPDSVLVSDHFIFVKKEQNTNDLIFPGEPSLLWSFSFLHSITITRKRLYLLVHPRIHVFKFFFCPN